MKNKLKVLILMTGIAVGSTGCSSTGGSLATGAGIGSLAGAGVGAVADPGPNGSNRFRNVVIGTAGGALVGAGTAYAIDRSNRDSVEDGKRQGRKDAEDEWSKRTASSSQSGSPELLPPKTEAKWIPDQVRGSTFVPGHFEYQIVAPARWDTKR